MKGTTLSSIRRVAITLLVMLLTTASAIAENNYWLTIDDNYEGGASTMVPVSTYANTITLTEKLVPTREGSTFCGWSTSSTGVVLYRTNDQITLTGNLTLYAVWYYPLKYAIVDGVNRRVMVTGYEGDKPEGTLNIPATVTINGIEYSVTSIANYAFRNCSNLQSVTIPNSVTNIGGRAFQGCSNLQSVTIPNSVTSIADFAFAYCSNLQSVTIPNSVTSIGIYAFAECSSLQSVTIPNSVTSIGNYAFADCSSIQSVTIPNSVTSIADFAFSGCSNLQSVTIPESVTSIGNYAFSGCSNLQSVTIPNSVTSIGNNAFKLCVNLQSVTIPNSVTSIGDYAFAYCYSLQSVTIPESVTSIGNYAFSDCSNLQSVTIPESVTSIGIYAFAYCSSLQSVTIPNSVTTIGNDTFRNCSSLQSVTIPNSVTCIGNDAFRNCSSLQSVTIPESVTSIGDYAFSSCFILQSVTIPNSVTTIGDDAFRSCIKLQSVTIPNSVTSIENEAFWGCRSLQSVTINGNPKIGTDAFLETPATVTMNLTASQIGNDYWTTFYNDGYNFQADENTTVYKATVNESSLVLTEVEDKIVNSGTAVILKSTSNPVMTLTETNSEDTNSNDLRGISDRDLRTSVISNFSANEIYTMGNTSAGFGFHRYTGEYVPAGEAFLPLYIDDEAMIESFIIVPSIVLSTSIKPVSSDKDLQKHWFTISGARLGGKPSHPGVYINGNKKVMIK